MGQTVEWGDLVSGSKNLGRSGSGGKDDKFLKLEGGKQYVIRPVHKAYVFYAYYIQDAKNSKKFRRAITEDPDNCVVKAKHGVDAKRRFAVNVFDRADGKLKIMEAPNSVFEAIARWGKAAKTDPGGRNGADFMIDVVIPSDGDKRRTEYKVTPVGPVSLTKEEIEFITTHKVYDLPEIFKPTPQSEIENKLFGEESDSPNKPQSRPTAPSAPSSSNAKNEDNDLGF